MDPFYFILGDTQDLLDLIMATQSKRMDEQRVEMPNLPGLCRSSINTESTSDVTSNTTESPGNQLDEKREIFLSDLDDEEHGGNVGDNKKSTVPDEDFFSLISRLQSGRMDDQRAKLKK